MKLLENKVALITGGSRGIGKSIVEKFVSNGCNVAFTYNKSVSDAKLIESNLSEKDIKIKGYKCDVAKFKNAEILANSVINDFGKIDILVNNAGTIHTALFQMTSVRKLKEIFQVNFFSQTIFTQYIIKSMMKRKSGSIIYISSSSALDSNIGRSAYSASKAALIAQSKTLSKELGSLNIRVNTIAPGLTNTDMMKENTSQEVIKEVTSNLSLKRIGEPNEIANLALFLASDLSSYITGQVIRIDGGMKWMKVIKLI